VRRQPHSGWCSAILNDAENEIGVWYQQLKDEEFSEDQPLPSLDPDDLYQDFCIGNGTLQFSLEQPEGCQPTGNQLSDYLNRQDVQTAINANATSWSVCSSTLNYSTSGESMIPFYDAFLNSKPSLKVLVYSGDVDTATVPFPYTQQCVNEIPGSVTSTWQPWYVNGWTAGYVEVREKFTYATVKGAGHEVPEYQPLNGLNMFSRFLTQGNLNDAQETSRAAANIALRSRKQLTQSQMLRIHNVRP